MLQGTDTDNVIKNIVKEIIRECMLKGIKTNDSLAASIIKLTVINPKNGFAADQNRPLLREDVERLVALCVARLADSNAPSLATIKMQVYVEAHLAPTQTLIDEYHANVRSKTASLLREIIETTALVYSSDDLEKIYRKMTVAVILLSGLGNPTNTLVFREASTAFGSVFRVPDLNDFLGSTRQEREDQVLELTKILMGIRIFNRDCHKGGEGIDDLPELLPRAINTTGDMLQLTLEKLMRRVTKWTEIVDSIAIDAAFGNGELPEDGLELREDATLVVDALGAARQMEVYVRKLLDQVRSAASDLDDLIERLRTTLHDLHATVRFRTAIPTEQVFPYFIELSVIWTGLQNVMVVLSVINSIASNLQVFSSILDFVSPALRKMLCELPPADAKGLVQKRPAEMPVTGLECKVLLPSNTIDFDQLPLEYLGFCAWTFVTKFGALVPAYPTLGVGQHNGLNYAFSSVAAGCAWGAAPEKFVQRGLLIALQKPELIALLQLHSQIDELSKTNKQITMEVSALKVVKVDSGMQTELHPVASYFDPDYSWNEWDLKRRALELANMRRCVTVSTQTKLSNFRGGVRVQAAPDKAQASQTMRDNSSNVPRLQNFIYGLRVYHGHDCAAGVFNLTRPVHE